MEDFNTSVAVTQRLNDDRHLEAAAIHAHNDIKSNLLSRGKARSWELWMDIRVTQSTNGIYFMTVGWHLVVTLESNRPRTRG